MTAELIHGDCLEHMKEIPNGSVDMILADPPYTCCDYLDLTACIDQYYFMEKRIFSKEHRENISKACMGRETWSKGKKMPKSSIYKNMAAHLRFDVSVEWLLSFEDIEKLKVLNRCITCKGGRFELKTEDYKAYIVRFYHDDQFNSVYEGWLKSGKEKWKRPTIDHINPRANGGCNRIENLQFLTWFENRAKCDMSQEDWDSVKANIKDYLI